jgi:hypothetical protein
LERAFKPQVFRVVTETAVTDDDLRRALLKHEPEIVHFSGHGSGRRGLVFEDAGEPLFIAADALAGLLRLSSNQVKCVVLNACYSEVQAQAISSVVDYVISMSRAIGDRAAIKFSTGFYDALASGRSYTDAFRFGCNAIALRGIPESLTPTLIITAPTQSDEDLTGAGLSREHKGENIRQVGKVLDASIQELIAVLDFRADMILAMMEEHNREASERVATRASRDMELIQIGEKLGELKQMFADLHEQNKRALISGEFILSHEITRKIQYLLFENMKNLILIDSYVYVYAEDPFSRLPEPWTFASDYPGPLPESLTEKPTPVILMWKQAEEERKRAQEEARKRAQEEVRKEEAERRHREAEADKQRRVVTALQQAAREKGILKEGDRCPKCGFSYAWDGTGCYHCHYRKDRSP